MTTRKSNLQREDAKLAMKRGVERADAISKAVSAEVDTFYRRVGGSNQHHEGRRR